MYLCGRLRWAFWLGVLAGWARPEVWPFLAVYGILLLRKHPNMRKDVIGGAVLTLFLWFGVPTITNGRPNIAGQLALRSPRECTTGKITCTVSRFTALDFIAIRAGGAARAGAGSAAAQLDRRDPGRHGRRLGRHRDRLRPPRLPRGAALPVRARRPHRRARRDRRRLAAARRQALLARAARMGRDPGGGGPGRGDAARTGSVSPAPSTRTSTTSVPAPRRSTSSARSSRRWAALSASRPAAGRCSTSST